MQESKYSKYFTHDVIRDGEIAPFTPRVKFNSTKINKPITFINAVLTDRYSQEED